MIDSGTRFCVAKSENVSEEMITVNLWSLHWGEKGKYKYFFLWLFTVFNAFAPSIASETS